MLRLFRVFSSTRANSAFTLAMTVGLPLPGRAFWMSRLWLAIREVINVATCFLCMSKGDNMLEDHVSAKVARKRLYSSPAPPTSMISQIGCIPRATRNDRSFEYFKGGAGALLMRTVLPQFLITLRCHSALATPAEASEPMASRIAYFPTWGARVEAYRP